MNISQHTDDAAAAAVNVIKRHCFPEKRIRYRSLLIFRHVKTNRSLKTTDIARCKRAKLFEHGKVNIYCRYIAHIFGQMDIIRSEAR
jgi:hypothetical protein